MAFIYYNSPGLLEHPPFYITQISLLFSYLLLFLYRRVLRNIRQFIKEIYGLVRPKNEQESIFVLFLADILIKPVFYKQKSDAKKKFEKKFVLVIYTQQEAKSTNFLTFFMCFIKFNKCLYKLSKIVQFGYNFAQLQFPYSSRSLLTIFVKCLFCHDFIG